MNKMKKNMKKIQDMEEEEHKDELESTHLYYKIETQMVIQKKNKLSDRRKR